MTRSLRIGITCHPTYGGSGAVAAELANALSRRGHHVHVVSYEPPFRLDPAGGVAFHRVDVPDYPLFRYPPYATALASRLAEVATDHELEILHAHYAIPLSVAALLAREITGKQDLRVVTTLHGTDITLIGLDPSYRAATAWAVGRSDRVTAVSKFLAQATHEGLDDGRVIDVIPNFIDTRLYVPSDDPARCRHLVDPGERLLVHVSNFRPVKRVLDVVEIFARVAKAVPARLVMVGDGPDRAAAERRVRELDLMPRVRFTGLLVDTIQILGQADAFLLPSDGESFGLSALEAMSCGVPVVGARAGGLPEVVRDGEDGILEPVGDVEAMAARLIELLTTPGLCARIGGQARRRAVDVFDDERIVPRYEDLYEAALSS